jgi:SAM-dependent methyltransferase
VRQRPSYPEGALREPAPVHAGTIRPSWGTSICHQLSASPCDGHGPRNVGAVADAHYENPRLASIYDPLDPDRKDLDVYAALVDELEARSALDIGCGTGTFACLLARRGLDVVGLDPAAASLDVARAKPGADRVRWIHGDAMAMPPLQVDVATMTGNVAQAIVTDDGWKTTLTSVGRALRPGGRLVFESRTPEDQAWARWTPGQSRLRAETVDAGIVESWVEVTDVQGALVSFRTTFEFERDGAVLTSDSTLRFRSRDELATSLSEADFAVREVRDAPDRPGREFVFIAQRSW